LEVSGCVERETAFLFFAHVAIAAVCFEDGGDAVGKIDGRGCEERGWGED
jgi:hypothetical protein